MGQLFAVEKATQMASISGASEQSDLAGGCVCIGGRKWCNMKYHSFQNISSVKDLQHI